MDYKISREDLLDLCRNMFDASVDNFMDLKEQACEEVLQRFLCNRKSCENHTMLSVNPATSWPNIVYTMTDGSFTSNQAPLGNSGGAMTIVSG